MCNPAFLLQYKQKPLLLLYYSIKSITILAVSSHRKRYQAATSIEPRIVDDDKVDSDYNELSSLFSDNTTDLF